MDNFITCYIYWKWVHRYLTRIVNKAGFSRLDGGGTRSSPILSGILTLVRKPDDFMEFWNRQQTIVSAQHCTWDKGLRDFT